MAVLEVKNLRKSYPDREVLKDLSFRVEKGQKIGIIGKNGAGKTTLFKILTDEISKDSGEININEEISFLTQELDLDEEMTLYDCCLEKFQDLLEMEETLRNLEASFSDKKNYEKNSVRYSKLLEKFEAQGGYSYSSFIKGTLISLGFKEDELYDKIKTLSGGQKSKLSLARLLIRRSEILFLDEPTNHLDIESINWLQKFLKESKKTILLISHDRYFLNAVCDRIMLIEDGISKVYEGNYDYYKKIRKEEIEQAKNRFKNQEREIKRQEEIIKRFLSLGRDRFIRQGKSRQKLLERMKKEGPPTQNKNHKIEFKLKKKSARDVLMLNSVKKSYAETLFEDVDILIRKGEKVGLIGANGIGKSTLLKIAAKKIEPDTGEVIIGSNVDIGYFDQELKSLDLDKTVIDEIWDEFPKFNHYEIRSYLASFNFYEDEIFRDVSSLSGGERARLSILKIMLKGANFLMLDEPTNHLDIDSKSALEDALKSYEGTILAVSHDRYFLNAVCEKIIALDRSGATSYEGNYDYYLEKTSGSEDTEEEYFSKTEKNRQKKHRREELLKKRQEKKIFEDLETEISNLEKELSTIDEKLLEHSLSGDYEEIYKLNEVREKLEKSLNKRYEEWMELEG